MLLANGDWLCVPSDHLLMRTIPLSTLGIGKAVEIHFSTSPFFGSESFPVSGLTTYYYRAVPSLASVGITTMSAACVEGILSVTIETEILKFISVWNVCGALLGTDITSFSTHGSDNNIIVLSGIMTDFEFTGTTIMFLGVKDRQII